jgi:hypothetical protein
MSEIIRKLYDQEKSLLEEFENVNETEQKGDTPKPDAKATSSQKDSEKDEDKGKVEPQEKAPGNAPVGKTEPQKGAAMPEAPATKSQKKAEEAKEEVDGKDNLGPTGDAPKEAPATKTTTAAPKEKQDELQPIEKKVSEAGDTKSIKATHPGILDLPDGKHFWQVPISHYVNLAKKKGKGAIMRALTNLERWNKNKEPEIAKKARALIDRLKANKQYAAIGATECVEAGRLIEMKKLGARVFAEGGDIFDAIKDIPVGEDDIALQSYLALNEQEPEGEPPAEPTETPAPGETPPPVEPPKEEKPEREYFGSKGDDSFYLVRKKNDEGDTVVDLQIVNAEDEPVMSVKENNPDADLSDEGKILLDLIKELEVDTISYDLFMENFYPILAGEEAEEEAEEKGAPEEEVEKAEKEAEKEAAEEGKVPNPVDSEEKKIKDLIEKEDEIVDGLLVKHNLK